MTHTLTWTRWLCLVFIYLNAASCQSAGPQPDHIAGPTRQELIGAWQLVSIQRVGLHGPTIDPFYNTGSTGILIYDASGWMSVQIAGQPRPAMEVLGSRPTLNGVPELAQLKAAVLDTYYAYYGTWEYDEATSKVTHHVKSSLIPGETGLSYSQTVTLDHENLIFTIRQEVAGGTTVQKKVWKRI
jgi:hypothetical protein